MKRFFLIILCMALLGSLFIPAFGEAMDARQVFVRVPSSWGSVSLCPHGENHEVMDQQKTAMIPKEDHYFATISHDLPGFTLFGSNGNKSEPVSDLPEHDLYVTVDVNGAVQVSSDGFAEPATNNALNMDATADGNDPIQSNGSGVDGITSSIPESDVNVAGGTEKETTVIPEEMSGTTSPAVREYCLVGYINGRDYGFEKDYLNIGEYIFVNGTLTTTFSADSYIFIKATDNQHWFLTTNYCTNTSGVFVENSTEKMFVPGNVELTFSLEELDATRISLSYRPTNEEVTSITDPTEPDDPVYSRSLVITPPETWNQVYIYTWEPEAFGKFPGVPVEQVDGEYVVIIPSTVKNLVVSNGQYGTPLSISSGKNLQTDDIFLFDNGKDIEIEIQKDHTFTVTYQGDKSARRPAAPTTEGLPSSYRVSGNSEWLGDWEADTELGIMTTITEGTYRKNFENVPPGKYELMITNNGTWEDSYGHNDGKNFVIEMDYPSKVTIEFKIDDGITHIDAYGYGIADTSNSGASTSSSGPTYSLKKSFPDITMFSFCLLSVCIYMVYLLVRRQSAPGLITTDGKLLRRVPLSQKDVENAVRQNMPAPSSKLDQSVLEAIAKAKEPPSES